MLDYLPIAAAAFGIPQYVPQIVKLRVTQDTAGVSWPWAALTSVNNTAWLAYFLLSHYWTASIPSTAAATLAGTVAVMPRHHSGRPTEQATQPESPAAPGYSCSANSPAGPYSACTNETRA